MLVLLVSYFPSIVWPAWTEVQSRAEGIDTSDITAGGITSALHNIDLSTGRPWTKLSILREHPDGRPYPITFWKLGTDLDLTILEVERLEWSNPCTSNWIDVIPTASSVSLAPPELVIGTSIARLSAPQVERAMFHGFLADPVCSETRLDIKNAVFDEGVSAIVSVHLELPVSTTSHRDFVLPRSKVKSMEVVFEY